MANKNRVWGMTLMAATPPAVIVSVINYGYSSRPLAMLLVGLVGGCAMFICGLVLLYKSYR